MELFHFGFLTVTWMDVIDVLLVTFLFYRLYVAMRGTIAAQIFLGLLIVIAGSLVARAADMKALSWLLKTLTDIWVIALIVLFQPELRRLLLFLGRNPVIKFFIRFDVNEYADLIVSALEELRQRGEGALIVIIRTTDIKLFVDTGLPIRAIISKELLVSIFNRKGPLARWSGCHQRPLYRGGALYAAAIGGRAHWAEDAGNSASCCARNFRAGGCRRIGIERRNGPACACAGRKLA